MWKVKSFPAVNSKSRCAFLPVKRRGAAWQPHQTGVSTRSGCSVLRRLRPCGTLALRDLPLHAFHEHYKFLRFMISLGLLAHLLEVLRSIADTIRHRGNHPQGLDDDKEALVYPIQPSLHSPKNVFLDCIRNSASPLQPQTSHQSHANAGAAPVAAGLWQFPPLDARPLACRFRLYPHRHIDVLEDLPWSDAHHPFGRLHQIIPFAPAMLAPKCIHKTKARTELL